VSKIAFHLTPLVAVLVSLLPAVPAQAQSIRTFVSTAGTDNPSCSLASPCRHFSAAVAATVAGGEVDALDPGAYGSFTISQAISIEGQGWAYVAPPPNGNAITISAGGSDKINIRGVSLNGVGTANTTGIKCNGGGSLNIQNSVVRNFGGGGIAIVGCANVAISNTLVSDNGTGISFSTPQLSTIKGIVSQSTVANNAGDGILLNPTNSLAQVMVVDTVVVNNASANLTAGLHAVSPGANLTISRSVITDNGTGVFNDGATAVNTYVDNKISGNGTDVTGTLAPLSNR
jgi:hypothetical protein